MTSAMTAEDRQASREADRELLEAVLEGDNTAYRGLVEKYQGRVYSMVYGMVRNREDARDITQEAFVKAYRNLKGFRLEASFYTWLYRIAMNLAIDYTRKRKRRETAGFDEQIATKDGDGGIHELHHGDSPRKALERKQLLLGRFVDVATELFAVSAACSFAQHKIKTGTPRENVVPLLDYLKKDAARRIDGHFRAVAKNNDESGHALSEQVLDGRFEWLEGGTIDRE